MGESSLCKSSLMQLGKVINIPNISYLILIIARIPKTTNLERITEANNDADDFDHETSPDRT